MDVSEKLIEALMAMRAFSRSQVASPDEADEYVQRACERILKLDRDGKLDSEINIEAYAITVIKNLVNDDHRARNRQRTEVNTGLVDGATTNIADPQANQFDQVELNDFFGLFYKLPDWCRELLSLLAIGHTYAEIAESLSLVASTVGTRTYRCRRALSELIEISVE